MKWFTDLLSPVQSTKEDLDAAVSAGERFGNGMAKAIEFILTPLTRLMDGIKWISENMPSWEGIKNSVSSAWERTKILRATLGNQQKKRQEVLGNHLRISLALVQMAKITESKLVRRLHWKRWQI